jgi:WD40 repeat protein
LWDVTTGYCCAILNGHTGNVNSVTYSPDGRQIATGSSDRTIRLWTVESAELHQTLWGHENYVRSVVYSPQGSHLASSGGDMTVRLWDVEDGECRFILIGHKDCVWCVTYSQKGDLLASGSHDKTVRLWDTVSGECRAVIQNFQDLIRAVDWNTTSDGVYLVTGGDDGSVLKWQVVEEEGLCRVRLQWSATNGTLIMTGASIEDVRGLTQTNKQLLKQRGAVGEPEHLFREVSKKVMTMASVVFKLKQGSDKVVQDPSSNDVSPSEQPSPQVEETNIDWVSIF